MLLLSKDDIKKGLVSLYAWEYDNKSIRKTYSFNAYTDGIKFVNEIAEISEKNNHHPDLYIGWRKVT
ncbi:MAG TPA: 4a-hydroxytetrahydrobiopterin dehydratase, partial [Pelagibacterales bacterium]|nr:4a-hydroxytetrahydrobiopterin dehydratase [Pelagibacterales bacterium]